MADKVLVYLARMVYISVQIQQNKKALSMSKNMKPIKLVKREKGGPLADLTDDQLQRIGEIALDM